MFLALNKMQLNYAQVYTNTCMNLCQN